MLFTETNQNNTIACSGCSKTNHEVFVIAKKDSRLALCDLCITEFKTFLNAEDSNKITIDPKLDNYKYSLLFEPSLKDDATVLIGDNHQEMKLSEALRRTDCTVDTFFSSFLLSAKELQISFRKKSFLKMIKKDMVKTREEITKRGELLTEIEKTLTEGLETNSSHPQASVTGMLFIYFYNPIILISSANRAFRFIT